MLYKHLFSILCGHLNLNQKRKKIEFSGLPVKPTVKLVKPADTPVNRSNRPVYRYEPFGQRISNSNLTSTGFPAKPVRYTGTETRRFGRTIDNVNPGQLLRWKPFAKLGMGTPRPAWGLAGGDLLVLSAAAAAAAHMIGGRRLSADGRRRDGMVPAAGRLRQPGYRCSLPCSLPPPPHVQRLRDPDGRPAGGIYRFCWFHPPAVHAIP